MLSVRTKSFGVLAVAATVALVAWLTTREWRSGDATQPILAKAGKVRAGSTEAVPFGTAERPASDVSARGAANAALGRAASNRVPIAPGSKAWRFEKPIVGDVSAGALYARLAQRDIDSNNAHDAAVFAEVMRRCRHRAMEAKLLQVERRQSKEATEFEKRQTELLERTIQETENLCSDAPSDAVARSDAWLTRAAELGDPVARYYFASGLHLSWVGDIAEIYKSPERLVEYKPRALEYLNELASQGHFDSLMHLSSIYLSPMYGPDPALSWAYLYAAVRAQGDSTKQSRVLRQLEAFSPEQRIRAERAAERIYEWCCQ